MGILYFNERPPQENSRYIVFARDKREGMLVEIVLDRIFYINSCRGTLGKVIQNANSIKLIYFFFLSFLLYINILELYRAFF